MLAYAHENISYTHDIHTNIHIQIHDFLPNTICDLGIAKLVQLIKPIINFSVLLLLPVQFFLSAQNLRIEQQGTYIQTRTNVHTNINISRNIYSYT